MKNKVLQLFTMALFVIGMYSLMYGLCYALVEWIPGYTPTNGPVGMSGFSGQRMPSGIPALSTYNK